MPSFWDFVFDHEFKQRADLEAVRKRAHRVARRTARQTRELEKRLEKAEDELGEMRLFTRALLALLQESGTLDAARIRDKILEIDASDGTVDGRYDPPAAEDDAPPPAPVPEKRTRR